MIIPGVSLFDEVYEQLPADGWLSREEAKLIWKGIQEVRDLPYPLLEVGSYQGRSTVLLASSGKPVICVDPFDGFHSELTGDEIYTKFQRNLHERNLNNVYLFRKKIEDWSPNEIPLIYSGEYPSLPLVYLDGDHTYQGTIRQIGKAIWCRPRVLLIHDYNDTGEGKLVKQAADLLLGPPCERVERLALWYTRMS